MIKLSDRSRIHGAVGRSVMVSFVTPERTVVFSGVLQGSDSKGISGASNAYPDGRFLPFDGSEFGRIKRVLDRITGREIFKEDNAIQRVKELARKTKKAGT